MADLRLTPAAARKLFRTMDTSRAGFINSQGFLLAVRRNRKLRTELGLSSSGDGLEASIGGQRS